MKKIILAITLIIATNTFAEMPEIIPGDYVCSETKDGFGFSFTFHGGGAFQSMVTDGFTEAIYDKRAKRYTRWFQAYEFDPISSSHIKTRTKFKVDQAGNLVKCITKGGDTLRCQRIKRRRR
jgi:hypothetical protein